MTAGGGGRGAGGGGLKGEQIESREVQWVSKDHIKTSCGILNSPGLYRDGRRN